MRLQMRRIDHQPRRLAGLACQFGEYLVEHPETAPAHEPVIDRLVRTIFAWCIAPAQPVPDDEDNPAYHSPVVNSRDPVLQRKIPLGASAPLTAETNQPWRR